MIRPYKLNFAICILLLNSLWGQELPPIKNFSPKDYGAENQNWSISQDKNKYIYVANNKGLLEYNGAEWTLYSSPNQTIFRSVKVIEEKIYTGFYMDFGFWNRNKFGVLEYTSLVKKLNLKLSEDEQFWNILQFNQWILFQSLKKIYLYNSSTNQYKVIDAFNKLTKMFKVNETIYFHKKGEGIFTVEEGKSKLFSDANEFKEANVIDIFFKDEKLFVLTDTKGFFYFENNQLKEWLEPNSTLKSVTTYNSSIMADGYYVVGTISNGVYFFNKNGELTSHIEQKDGINNNTVLAVFEDLDKNVWLGLDNGVSIINRKSNIKIFRNNNGALGTIYGSIVYNGNLYLGTNQGLFYKKYNTNDDFTFIENTQGQVWSLKNIEGTLFCNHDSGIYIIENNALSYKIPTQGTWDLKQINKDLLISGDYEGLTVLTLKNGKWVLRNKIDGFANSSKYFEFYNDSLIFVNHEYKGVFKLKVDKNYSKVISSTKDTLIDKGLHSSLIKYKNDILYAYKKGIFNYSEIENRFKRNDKLSNLFSDETYVSGKLIYEKESDILWAFSSKYISYVTTGKLSNEPTTNQYPINNILREGATGYENISSLNFGEKLIGTYNGYIIIDPKKPPLVRNKRISINSIKVGGINTPKDYTDLENKVDFPLDKNNIEFYYSLISYDSTQDVEYQYKLEGYNSDWSNWSKTPKAIFENLKHGNYTFLVKAKIGNTPSTNVAAYSFTINRPWYISNLMIIAYVVGFALLIILIQFLNRKYYKKQGRYLLEKQQREFELQELAKEKELISLKNEQLKSDVESKNRELATSTMSIIKKNEFLNSIKNELKKEDSSNINKVIKIIDKDLNNTNDWKMFEEAFNNADKDFIKKVKSLHSELTPNDLRLCAYLRLNLPSKEIAPLLNISPRSVEVKRYRLRKKMNLDHKQNLTDYILSL